MQACNAFDNVKFVAVRDRRGRKRHYELARFLFLYHSAFCLEIFPFASGIWNHPDESVSNYIVLEESPKVRSKEVANTRQQLVLINVFVGGDDKVVG